MASLSLYIYIYIYMYVCVYIYIYIYILNNDRRTSALLGLALVLLRIRQAIETN